MQFIFITSGGDGLMTMVGVDHENESALASAFESLRGHEMDEIDANFVLDLHDSKGDLVDSIFISADSYHEITGYPVLSEAEYIANDETYWAIISEIDAGDQPVVPFRIQ